MTDFNDSISFVENFTIVLNLTIQEKYSVSYISDPGLVAVILYVVMLVTVETLGNFLIFCMILYEKYGMDPQKRTIANQLLTRMLIVQIFFNIFIMPLSLFTVFGLHSKYFAIIKKVQAFQKDFTKYSNLNFANYRVSQVKLDKTKKLF